MNDIWIALIALLAFLALDLASIAARSAFLQTNHARLLALREQMELQVNRTVPLLSTLTRLRASLDLSLVVTRFLFAGLGLILILRLQLSPQWAWAAIALTIPAIVLFWLEWMVERFVMGSPEHWAIHLTVYVRVMMAILSLPLALPMLFAGESVNAAEMAGSVTEDELKTLVDAGQEEGVLEQGERRMIYSIFRLGDTRAREIMVPRIDMLALEVHTSPADAIDALLASGHSRVPVYEETVDKTLGVLYAKDLLRLWQTGEHRNSLYDLLRPAYFIPEAKRLDELLADMQSQRIHIAIVVDEYGGVAGMVTLEDIVEEILGEIWDEYDQGEESPYQVIKEGEYIFQGRIDLEHLNELLGSALSRDEADTLAGFIYNRLGRVPAVGDTVREGDLTLTVEQVSARRIRKVRVRWTPHDSGSGAIDGDVGE